MKCAISAGTEAGKMVKCDLPAEVKCVFLDGEILPVCRTCFYDHVVHGAAIGFIHPESGTRVDFTHTSFEETEDE